LTGANFYSPTKKRILVQLLNLQIMRIKTIVIVLVTIFLTVTIMQNTGPMAFNILWMHFNVSKLIVMLLVAIAAFVLGWMVGRPKRRFNLGDTPGEHDDHSGKPGTLSEEDRDYIN
jgi:lipopolysaccharide assembly protein A